MDLLSDPLAWRESDVLFAGMQQYPLISDEHHPKPSMQDSERTVMGGSGDLSSIYQSSQRYEFEGKAADQIYTNYSMNAPLSTSHNMEEGGGQVGFPSLISPANINALGSDSFHPLEYVDRNERFYDYHVPMPMTTPAESASSLASSLGCSNPACGCGDQITQQVDNPQEIIGDCFYDPTFDGSYAIEFGSCLSTPMDSLLDGDASLAKAAIKTHALYPYLLAAHIDCCKIGAEPADVKMMEEAQLKHLRDIPPKTDFRPSAETKNELDNAMAWYLGMLVDLKEKMDEPFFIEKEWCNEVYEKLRLLGPPPSPVEMPELDMKGQANPCDQEGRTSVLGETGQKSHAPSFDDTNGMIMEQGRVVKEWLRSKHDSSQIYSLRRQCRKKRKQGKHSHTARELLVDWFNDHGEWPYPSEEEKVKLAQLTKLEARQINNWFINQRKRHWDSPTKEEPANHLVQNGIKRAAQVTNSKEVFVHTSVE